MVKAYIWVMYSAAGTTARLGFATPRPLPPAWTESGWPQSDAQAADPCSPVSYVVPAFRAVFVVQWALIMFQVLPPIRISSRCFFLFFLRPCHHLLCAHELQVQLLCINLNIHADVHSPILCKKHRQNEIEEVAFESLQVIKLQDVSRQSLVLCSR